MSAIQMPTNAETVLIRSAKTLSGQSRLKAGFARTILAQTALNLPELMKSYLAAPGLAETTKTL